MKTTTHNPNVSAEEQNYKKRFLVRMQQEQEAEQEIALQRLLRNGPNKTQQGPSPDRDVSRFT